jgi:hypothetical protein
MQGFPPFFKYLKISGMRNALKQRKRKRGPEMRKAAPANRGRPFTWSAAGSAAHEAFIATAI